MTQPTSYTPTVDFSDEEADAVGGRSTVRTAAIDAELAAISTTLAGVLANLSLNQRDDGEIRDSRVKLHTLASDVLALLAATAGNPRGAWVTATAYLSSDLVTQGGNTYICSVAHTSGTFATDLAAVKWLLFSLGTTPAATGVGFTATATIAATNVQAAIEESDTENRALSASLTSGISATLLALYASATDAAKGTSAVGYGPDLANAAGTAGAALQDAGVHVAPYLITSERAQVKANGTTIDLTPRFTSSKTYGGNRPQRLMGGTWATTALSYKIAYGGLVGEGMITTTLKAKSAIATQIDAGDVADVIVSPYTVRGMTLDGNSLSNYGVRSNFRHHHELRDLYVVNQLVAGIREKDTWLGRHHNVRISAVPIGLHLEGSNHGSMFYGTTITNCSNTHLLLESLGTAADGNDALSFYGLTIGDGAGYGVDDGATSSAFYGSYLGENLGLTVFTNRVGTAVIDGGVLFFGDTASTYAFSPLGGTILVRGVRLNGQASASTSLLTTGSGGKVKFEDCQFNFVTGGDPVVSGDPIGYGAAYQCFAPKNGRLYTGAGTNCTVTTTNGTNVRTFTVSAVAGGTQTMAVTAALTVEWDAGTAFLVVTYSSNIAMNCRLAGASSGTLPLKAMATLPTTAGVVKTLIKLDGTLDIAAYTLLEFYTNSAVLNSTFSLYSVNLSDQRMPLGNLWKC